MPELPEVETARSLIGRQALNRRIVTVDDTDTYVIRPHSPGQLRAALTGRTLTAALRRGKTMWCETSGLDGASGPGPELGIHLGMSGRIVVTGPGGGSAAEGGDPHGRDAQPRKAVWNRFTLGFADGGSLVLFQTALRGCASRPCGSPPSAALPPPGPVTTMRPLMPRWMPRSGPGPEAPSRPDVSHHIALPRRSAAVRVRPVSAARSCPGECGRMT